MKKNPTKMTPEERLREIACIFAQEIVRMVYANILLSSPSKPTEPSLSKPSKSITPRISG
ncbi:hypothetical protein KQI63_08850 [bacterium]|nr:hypothetical protein [bacterium]